MKINKLITLPVVIACLALGSFGVASAQVASPRVALQFGSNGLTSPLVASSSNATIARLLLDTTGSTEAVRINSLPFNLVTGSGAMAGTLQNCRVYNETDMNNSLNTPASTSTGLSSGINTITFNSALVLPANTMTTLALQCNVAGDLVSSGTYMVNMNTNNVVAYGAVTGTPAAVTIRGTTTVPPVTTPTPSTPGLPTTGAAGEAAQNIAMVVASLLIAMLGFTYLNTRQREN